MQVIFSNEPYVENIDTDNVLIWNIDVTVINDGVWANGNCTK